MAPFLALHWQTENLELLGFGHTILLTFQESGGGSEEGQQVH